MSGNLPYNEKELLIHISEGDEKSFAILFTHYYPQMYALVHRFSLADEDVREALQEAFVSVWLKREQLAEVENIKGWLLRIAARKCRDVLRKTLQNQRAAELSGRFESDISNDSPAVNMHVAEVRRLVHEVILRMPEQRKRIYLLSREEGLKPAEIAAQLSLSVSTVKNTLVTALKQIREHLAACGYYLPEILLLFFCTH